MVGSGVAVVVAGCEHVRTETPLRSPEGAVRASQVVPDGVAGTEDGCVSLAVAVEIGRHLGRVNLPANLPVGEGRGVHVEVEQTLSEQSHLGGRDGEGQAGECTRSSADRTEIKEYRSGVAGCGGGA